MTRETRIGLLVGLLFIVLFGLVLADYANPPSKPPIQTQKKELALPMIEEGPVRADPPAAIAAKDPALAARDAAPGGVDPPAGEKIASADKPMRVVSDLAPMPPDRFIVVDSPGRDGAPDAKGVGPTDASSGVAATEAKSRAYTVEAGDSLRKIARKVYGPTREMEYKRICEANKDTVPTETSLLVIGKVLVIPSLPDAAPAKPSDASALAGLLRPGRDAGGVREMDANELRAHLAGRSTGDGGPVPAAGNAAAPAKKTYVVQKGDSLSKIVRRCLNDDSRSAIQKLIQANSGKIKGPEQVLRIGMELEIPS